MAHAALRFCAVAGSAASMTDAALVMSAEDGRIADRKQGIRGAVWQQQPAGCALQGRP